MTGPRRDNRRGSAALLGLLFGLAMIAILSAVTSLTAVHAQSAARHRRQAEARTAAESGAAACLSALAGGRQVGRMSGTVPGGRYRVRCSQEGSSFRIESTGTVHSDTGPSADCLIRLSGRLEAGKPRYTGCSVDISAWRGKR
ncbi:MAG: hypothetical protein JSV79_06435 [Armatimonadota bacterium]|nr:MAG: hypothetical protein JSV79_06435 [Armatimonadota bacterium]